MKKNPVFWLMWLLPGTAVVASFVTLAIALQRADRALPDLYHWEGERLDADFERARNAERLGMRATLSLDVGRHYCKVTVNPAAALSRALTINLTNVGQPELDRSLTLIRTGVGEYGVACGPLSEGRWLVALEDRGGQWALRGKLSDARQVAVLVARRPEG